MSVSIVFPADLSVLSGEDKFNSDPIDYESET